MTVISRMNHCQPLSVVAVRIGSQLMFNLMNLKIRQTAAFQNPVFRHGRIPHQVASCLTIIDINEQAAHIDNCVAHDRQRHIIGYIVLIRISQISLHGMAQCIKSAGKHLHARHRHGVSRIKNGKGSGGSENRSFPFLLLISDYCTPIHFRTGAGSSNHCAHWNPRCGELPFSVLHIPDVFTQHSLRRNYLTAVDHTAAAYR